jgi:Caenorhabditis protein of unknown function, DUF268
MQFRSGLKRVGWYLVRLSEANIPEDHLDLSGDRDIEWSWVAGNLPENSGEVLDFGPSNSTSGLIAAFHGGKVIGLDLEPPPRTSYQHSGLSMRHGDILTYDFGDQRFDTVINCSTVEHVGLPGRYGSPDIADGDLQAMQRLRGLMRVPASRMVLTIPVGIDGVFVPYHRVYGAKRLALLTSGFSMVRQAYFAKTLPGRQWKETTRDAALSVQGSASFYALGLFVLAPS